MIVFGALCLLFALACGTTNTSVNTEDTLGVEATGGLEATEGIEAPQDIEDTRFELKVLFRDFMGGAPLSGLTLEGFGQQVVTDAEGVATLMVPHKGDMALTLKGPGIRDHYLYSQFDSADVDPDLGYGITYSIATENTLTILEGQLQGITIEDTAGLLSLGVRNRATNRGIPGMHLATDASAALQAVIDVNSPFGFSPGNTTLANSPSLSVFINIEPGDVTPIFTHEDDWTCEGSPMPIPIPAGSYVIIGYSCDLAD